MKLGRSLLPLGLVVVLALSVHAATGRRLQRTREVLKGVGLSFVGQPTRGELLLGGLAALVRLSPGLEVEARKDGSILVRSGKRKLAFNPEGMVADSEVAAALERTLLLSQPKAAPTEVDDAVASSMVTALADRHSAYLRPYFMERLGYSDGEHLGDAGIDVKQVGSRVAVRSVSIGSAAAAAGIKPGELLRRVDSHNVDALSLGEIGALLLGQEGSTVELTLEPKGGGEPRTVVLKRDPPYALQPHIRVIDDVLHIVPGPLLGNAWKAAEQALKERPPSVKGVVLDFRGNGGGQVGDAVALADLFVPEGPVAVVVGRATRPVQRFEAKTGDAGEKLPVVILVDGRTASATELASLILRERLEVPLMGAPTYGKGSVQKLLPISGGGYLKITSAMYSTTFGTTVGEGIRPDVMLDPATFPKRGEEGSLQTDAWMKAAHDEVLKRAGGDRRSPGRAPRDPVSASGDTNR